MYKLDLDNVEESETKFSASVGSWKKQGNSRKTSSSASLTLLKLCDCVVLCDIDCVDHNKLWKILKEMGIPDHLTCFLRTLYAGQKATV